MEVQAFYVVPTDIVLGRRLLLVATITSWPFLSYPGRGIGVFCYRGWKSRLSTWPFLMWVGRATGVFLWCWLK